MNNNKEYTSRLENIIKQMLSPLRDIPFNLVIETMTGKRLYLSIFIITSTPRYWEKLKQQQW